jgi:hypothetical protein
MVAVFIYELVVNAQAQGSPFSFHVSQSSYSSLPDFQLKYKSSLSSTQCWALLEVP